MTYQDTIRIIIIYNRYLYPALNNCKYVLHYHRFLRVELYIALGHLEDAGITEALTSVPGTVPYRYQVRTSTAYPTGDCTYTARESLKPRIILLHFRR